MVSIEPTHGDAGGHYVSHTETPSTFSMTAHGIELKERMQMLFAQESLEKSKCRSADSPGSASKPLRNDWMGRVDCTISLIAATVGLGNVTIFPFLAYKHGAGTFLFPFIILTVVMAVPLYYLEALLGQISGQGAVLGWKMAPLLQGVGVSICVTSVTLTAFYSVMCAYPLFYFGSSFISPLPWAHCDYPWNTQDCIFINLCDQPGQVKMDNGSCYSEKMKSAIGIWNGSAAEKATNRTYVFSSNEYWIEFVAGKGELGPIQGHLVVCLLVVWTISFLALARDVVSLGKILIFGVLVMYMVLVILVINGALLPRGIDGVIYFLTPKWEVFSNSEVWFEASAEAFFGVVIGTGVITTFTSYSRYSDGDPLRMSITVVLVDSLTSILGGFVLFTRLGHLANQLGKPIEDIASFHGYLMAYVVYPESILRHKVGPFLSIMFFFALSGLAITCQIAFASVPATMLLDLFPSLARRRFLTLFVFSLVGFFICFPFTLKGGNGWVSMIYSTIFNDFLIFNGLMEVVVVSWGYGVDNFLKDIVIMTGKCPSRYFRICWKYVIPVYLVVLLLWRKSVQFSTVHDLTRSLSAFPFLMPLMSLLLTMVYCLWRVKTPVSLREKIKATMTARPRWTRAPVKTVPMHATADPNLSVESENKAYEHISFPEGAQLCIPGDTPLTYIKKEVLSEAKLLRGISSSWVNSSSPSRTPSQTSRSNRSRPKSSMASKGQEDNKECADSGKELSSKSSD